MDERQAPPPPPLSALHSLDDVAKGQRMLIVAILVNIGAAILNGAGADFAVVAPVAAIAAVTAIIGLLRMTTGLGYSSAKQILLFVLAFVPLASLVMLVTVNARATKALRAGGYQVGLLGARPKKRPA